MIPNNQSNLLELTVDRQPSRTFKLDLLHGKVVGMVDEIEAVRQAIYLALTTERFEWPIYSWDYGVEFLELIGREREYVLPEVKRRITEALMQDDRITAVDGFHFDIGGKTVTVTFTAHTIYGDTEVNTVV